MEKVYIVCLMYDGDYDGDIEFKVATSKDRAREVLKNWALEEERNSWISEYDESDFDYYDFDDDNFDVACGDHRTTIFIKETEVL